MTNWKYTDLSQRVVSRTMDDGSTQSVLAGSPETFTRLADGSLGPSMTIDPLTPAETTAQQAVITTASKLGVDIAAVRADAAVVAFLTMTPAQIDTYVDTNFPGAAAPMPNLRVTLKILGKVLAVTARYAIATAQ